MSQTEDWQAVLKEELFTQVSDVFLNNELDELNEFFPMRQEEVWHEAPSVRRMTRMRLPPRKSAIRLAFVKFVAACGFVKYISVSMAIKIRSIRVIRC